MKTQMKYLQIETGRYTRKTKTGEFPVFVEGYVGEHNGVHYVRIKNSKEKVPWNELTVATLVGEGTKSI
jgi:hypothetical protein